MNVVPTKLKDAYILEPRLFHDERGYFMESYNARVLEQFGILGDFIQDNQSLSMPAGTLRGLHFQQNPMAQTKIVRCVSGAIYDVIVDIRRGSPTYGEWIGVYLTADNHQQLVVPKGFAHGFCTLAPNTIVTYKVDEYYCAKSDGGIAWDDPDLGIDWPITDPFLSSKDSVLPKLKDAVMNFIYEEEM